MGVLVGCGAERGALILDRGGDGGAAIGHHLLRAIECREGYSLGIDDADAVVRAPMSLVAIDAEEGVVTNAPSAIVVAVATLANELVEVERAILVEGNIFWFP